MGIQEVQGNSNAQAYQKKRKAERGEGFQESFLQNLKDRNQAKQTAADVQSGARQNSADTLGEAKKADKAGMGRIGMASGIRVNAAALQESMQIVEVRRMSYEESDHVKIAVTEGYTLKGKREDSAGERVYVEAKYDDGRLEAYQVETGRIPEDTKQEIERFALETVRRRSASERVWKNDQ